MSVIIGFSGKKQSGKNTACNVIMGIELKYIGVIEQFRLTDKGKLIVGQLLEGKIKEYKIDSLSREPLLTEYLKKNAWPNVKMYSFAELLKQNICIDVLGLTEEQCYGTDEDKNTETHLEWSDMPQPLLIPHPGEYKINDFMTAREVMQYIGTNIFRQMYSNVWVDGLMRQIKKDNPAIALVADVRFPNEVEGIQKSGGKVIRLTRSLDSADEHKSETALDEYDGFDAILDNSDMTIIEQSTAICEILGQWSYLPPGLEIHI